MIEIDRDSANERTPSVAHNLLSHVDAFAI
jgi:hypothetical protein